MTRRRRSAEPLAAVLAAAVALGFFASDMIGAAGWDWRTWLADVAGASAPAADISEIRNYVEFVSVTAGPYLINTGIEFDSSFQRRTVKQWCYLEHLGTLPGAPEPKLSLATMDAAGTMQPNIFTPDNLAPFGLTAAEARAFIKDHCRFR